MEHRSRKALSTRRQSVLAKTALAAMTAMMLGTSEMSVASECRNCFLMCDAKDNNRRGECEAQYRQQKENCRCSWIEDILFGCDSQECDRKAIEDRQQCEWSSEDQRKECIDSCMANECS